MVLFPVAISKGMAVDTLASGGFVKRLMSIAHGS